MAKDKLFTKSAFKVALECPWKLFYYENPNVYANANTGDEFLQSLADGGFQVGALAKIYYAPGLIDLQKITDHDEAVKETNEFLQRNDVTIAEAAFRFNNLFVRVDLLEKHGNNLNLIEVKAKSWNPDKDTFIGSRPKGAVKSKFRPYLYDVAFQKYVVTSAMKGYNVKAFIMMADKRQEAQIDNLNKMFKISKGADCRAEVIVDIDDTVKDKIRNSKPHILTPFDVDEECNLVIEGKTTEQSDGKTMLGLGFNEFVRQMADCYCNNRPYSDKPLLCSACFGCEFHKTKPDDEKADGKRKCWLSQVSEQDYDSRPLLETLNGQYISRDEWMRQGVLFMDQLEDLKQLMKKFDEKKAGMPGLDHLQRKWLQVAMETGNEDEIDPEISKWISGDTYLDKEGLMQEMETWEFPLHMIDFETTAVALPYYSGMKPYEQVAFQFSHHIIREDGTIEHIGQYLNDDVNEFPNFNFIRELKKQLEGDAGTIFRYSNHENTILRHIARQLETSNEPEKDELIAFIRSITHCDDRGCKYKGERDMKDLWEVVKLYYLNLGEMHGKTSIKQVLPAVLNSSKYLQDKYRQEIYGSVIPSKNIDKDKPIAWVKFDEETGKVINPYKNLASVGKLIGMSEGEIDRMEELSQSDEEYRVANGGAALSAYNKLMFCQDENNKMAEALREALLRYCELDTMSMVFIWEYFNDECKK